MALILPNQIANLSPADGDKLDQNFDTIVSWGNQDVISADGSTAMRAPLLLPGAPTQPNQAATKDYVDNNAGFIGEMRMFAGDTVPHPNWMFCRAQPMSKASYAALFNVIGYKYGGSGDTFNLPSMAGRSPMGHWAGGTWAPTLGQMIGTSDAVVPSHKHTGVTDHYHANNFSVGNGGIDHIHGTGAGAGTGLVTALASGIKLGDSGGVALYVNFNYPTGGASAYLHNHPMAGQVLQADRPLETGYEGVAGTNQNIGPSTVCNFIIRVQ